MMIRGHVEARPWKPQDLLDDLQKMIDEEPDAYLNDRRTTLCTARDYLKEYFNTYLPEQKKAIDSGLPLHYYPVYRKALRDLKDGIEKVGDGFKRYSMNNWKGMMAVIDMVLADPEKLMYSASLEGYEIPEPYITKFRAWQRKQKEKLEAERNAKDSDQAQKEMEIEAIKAIKNLFPTAEYIERIKNSNIVGIGNSENGWIADINNALFPSLKPGDYIDISSACRRFRL